MTAPERRPGGSRFLYEPFHEASVHKVDMFERVLEERWSALEYRLGLIEGVLERLERRFWLAVFGVVSAILVQAAQGLMGQSL
ncbi:MAG: GTA head formation protein, RCAP_rcc01685 family [Brevirhabdus sp.]